MKRKLRTLLCVLSIFLLPGVLSIFLLPAMVFAGEISLAWDANTEPDLKGYKIYWGTETGKYDAPGSPVDVANTTQFTLKELTEGKIYYMAATAYDTDNNESSFSVELSHMVNNLPPGEPQNLDVVLKSLNINITIQP